MSMTWRVDPGTNDLTINGSGGLMVTTGADEVHQRIIITLKHYYGEYFLNIFGGVPWYELLLGTKDLKLVEAVLRQIVLEVPGVKRLDNVQIAKSVGTRGISMSMIATVQGTFGLEVVNVVFGG